MSNALVYLNSVVASDAPEGMFARVLRYDVSGVRYHGPPNLERAKGSRVSRYRGGEFARPSKPPSGNAKPRWTQERLDALPKKNGHYSVIGFGPKEGALGLHVYLRCDGPSAQCSKRLVTPITNYVRKVTPKGCWACAMQGRRNANPPYTAKGSRVARDHVAKAKGRAS